MNMKKIIAALLSAVFACVTLAVCATGCNKTTYSIYTNIPSDEFTVTAADFKVEQVFGESGPLPSADGAENADGITSKTQTFYAMDTEASLVVSADFSDNDVLTRYYDLCEDISGLLIDIELSLSSNSKSVTRPDLQSTYIYAFNRAPAGATVELDKTAYEVLSTAKYIYDLTGGYYNPAVYYCVYEYGFLELYGFMTEENLPSDGDIEKYRELSTSFAEVELFEEEGIYYAVKPQATVIVDGEECALKIDLGGIGKGYAVDKVNALLDEYGFEYGYFNFGSSSITVRSHYKNGAYSIGFTNPRPAVFGDIYVKMNLGGVCLSTSGDYEQYYEIDGVRYCHIIDPTTGRPVQTGIMTATVIGGSAAEDDALTTAIMAMGRDRAIEFINSKLSDRYVIFTYSD